MLQTLFMTYLNLLLEMTGWLQVSLSSVVKIMYKIK